jgi:hypothetical protein
MCEESTVEVKSSESKGDQDKRENVEAKVNARNDKSQYHLRMYCESAKQHSYCDGYLDRPKKAYPRQIPTSQLHATPGEPDANCCVRFCPAFVPALGLSPSRLAERNMGFQIPMVEDDVMVLRFGRCKSG